MRPITPTEPTVQEFEALLSNGPAGTQKAQIDNHSGAVFLQKVLQLKFKPLVIFGEKLTLCSNDLDMLCTCRVIKD